jgi:hypothetical protein
MNAVRDGTIHHSIAHIHSIAHCVKLRNIPPRIGDSTYLEVVNVVHEGRLVLATLRVVRAFHGKELCTGVHRDDRPSSPRLNTLLDLLCETCDVCDATARVEKHCTWRAGAILDRWLVNIHHHDAAHVPRHRTAHLWEPYAVLTSAGFASKLDIRSRLRTATFFAVTSSFDGSVDQ